MIFFAKGKEPESLVDDNIFFWCYNSISSSVQNAIKNGRKNSIFYPWFIFCTLFLRELREVFTLLAMQTGVLLATFVYWTVLL